MPPFSITGNCLDLASSAVEFVFEPEEPSTSCLSPPRQNQQSRPQHHHVHFDLIPEIHVIRLDAASCREKAMLWYSDREIHVMRQAAAGLGTSFSTTVPPHRQQQQKRQKSSSWTLQKQQKWIVRGLWLGSVCMWGILAATTMSTKSSIASTTTDKRQK
mmetsp:Transcript_23095/g.43981  ORF Transcript_23095/g.43981 Transcript_23095/m.43981 type:complete len:159 (+) Transcript_23095:334-810(+)